MHGSESVFLTTMRITKIVVLMVVSPLLQSQRGTRRLQYGEEYPGTEMLTLRPFVFGRVNKMKSSQIEKCSLSYTNNEAHN